MPMDCSYTRRRPIKSFRSSELTTSTGGQLTLLGAQELARCSHWYCRGTHRKIRLCIRCDRRERLFHRLNYRHSTDIGSSPAISFSNCSGVWVEPSGKYLYATTSTSNSGAIYGYQINADGSLTALASNALVSSNQPAAMTFKALIQ